jgi:hypothetical protein
MFQLAAEESGALRGQFGALKNRARKAPEVCALRLH